MIQTGTTATFGDDVGRRARGDATCSAVEAAPWAAGDASSHAALGMGHSLGGAPAARLPTLPKGGLGHHCPEEALGLDESRGGGRSRGHDTPPCPSGVRALESTAAV